MKPNVVNVADAKARLSELIERAANGEEIVLARAGKPRAKIVGLKSAAVPERLPGKGKGRLRIKKGFDDPLPVELVELFEGSR